MSLSAKYEVLSFDAAEAALRTPEEAGRPRTLVVFAGADLALGDRAKALLKDALAQLERAAAAAKFKGKSGSSFELLAPSGVPASRLLIIGVGGAEDGDKPGKFDDYLALGGQTGAKLGQGSTAIVLFDLPEAPSEPASAATQFALGGWLRSYKFDQYKTKKKDDADKDAPVEVKLGVADAESAKALIGEASQTAEAVALARTLVNEPANVLSPAEFARARQRVDEARRRGRDP